MGPALGVPNGARQYQGARGKSKGRPELVAGNLFLTSVYYSTLFRHTNGGRIMVHALQTVGYERASVEDFIATLLNANIKRVVDVRAVPVSRKRGFSKKILGDILREQGIEYLHIPALGDPKPGRDAARAGRYAEFKRIYKAHLRTASAQAGLKLAAQSASEINSCLLCYERDSAICHRSMVAERVSFLTELEVKHLTVTEGAGADSNRAVRRSPHPREGRTTAQPEIW